MPCFRQRHLKEGDSASVTDIVLGRGDDHGPKGVYVAVIAAEMSPLETLFATDAVGSGSVDLDHRQEEPEQNYDVWSEADSPRAITGIWGDFSSLQCISTSDRVCRARHS